MADDNGFVADFCGVNNIQTHFSNALGRYTPCFVDAAILAPCHLLGFIFFVLHWHRIKTGKHASFRLKGSAWGYQWCAFIASVLCFVLSLFEFGARLGESQILISPDSAMAPYEYLSFVLAALFWFVAFMVLYRELHRFTWSGLWTIRFAVCLVVGGQLAKFSFIVQPDLTEQDENYAMFMISVACHLFLALFSATQIPSLFNLTSLSFHGYEEIPAWEETVVVWDTDVIPEKRVNFLSSLLFTWISPFLRRGFRQPLEFDDIWLLDNPDKAESLLKQFRTHWTNELTLGQGRGERRWNQPSLFRALWKSIGHLFLMVPCLLYGAIAFPLKLIVDASQFSGPLFLGALLDAVKNNDPSWKQHMFAVAMFAGSMAGTLADNQHFQLVMRAGFRLRSVVTTEVQRKALFLTPTERAKFSSGQIFNFVASDSESLQLVCQNVLSVISSPLRMIGATAFLFQQLGVSSLVAVAALVMLVPVQTAMVRFSARYVRQALKQTDERAKLEGELVSGIDAVKCNAWEEPFWNRILAVRSQELLILWRSFVLGALNVFIVTSVPAVMTVSTFGVYVLLGNELTASKAFVSLTLFNVLRFPMFQLPQVISQLTQASVSIKRLENFLKVEEQDDTITSAPAPPGEAAITTNGDFAWDIGMEPTLPSLRMTIPSGSLTAIVGPTGSGKSSVLSSVVGLMQRVSGTATEVCGSLCLVPQTPFIINATVKNNILFGSEFDEARYSAAIQVSSLGPDLEMFPGGDETELGEKGVNVSGGQKQRIALARAVYSDADVCLLDDPLSALDAHVGRSVFYDCIAGALKGKTVVLVTNQLQYVHAADRILYLQNGRITEDGTFDELMKLPNGGFAQMMAETAVEEEATKDDKHKKKEKAGASSTMPVSTQAGASATAVGSDAVKESQLIQKEHRSFGIVSWKVIKSYGIAMGGVIPFVSLAIQFLLVELIRVGSTVWLSVWTDDDDENRDEMVYMGIYGAIVFSQVVVVFINQLDFRRLGCIASDVLHRNMLFKLVRAPMSFYHTTPIGRIVNRLTKDTADIDKNLVDMVVFFLRSALQLVSMLILIAVTAPLSTPFLVPIVLLFFFIYVYFQASAREIKRLDSISRSPVYSSINESLNGLATIRAFSSEKRMMERHMQLVDENIIMALLNQSINRWLSLRLETLGGLVTLVAAVVSIVQQTNPSIMGLTISYALNISVFTSITVRLASIAESIFNAVERVVEYSELEEEATDDIPGSTPDNWPDEGGVTFSDVKMRYRPELPLVLQGLSAAIQPKQRVGVVGRTGAGKSSLMNALFRTVELSDGQIIIDGVDTSSIGLKQLRSKIAIIPQVPFLFTGSIRTNLDPFNDHDDEVLWAALDRAHLSNVVRNHGGGLDMELHEGGAPLSSGQTQLLSLARAIVRDTKILILDEATANVDVDTDALIQETIKAEFSDKTVIAIAHRLHTIIDGDKVMVLDRGMLAEFDSPANLLRNPNGIFTSMVKDTGEASERFLRSVAFGEVDMKDARANEAAKGLERMASVCSWTSSGWTSEVLGSAQQALKSLSDLREQLVTERRRLQTDSDIGTDLTELEKRYPHASDMQDAMKLVNQIERIAKEAKMLLKYQGMTIPDPSVYGMPAMEALGVMRQTGLNLARSTSQEETGTLTPTRSRRLSAPLRDRRSASLTADRRDFS